MKLAILAAVSVAILAAPHRADAGERLKLSELPTLPAVRPMPSPIEAPLLDGVKIASHHAGSSEYWEATAATRSGYCFVRRDSSFELMASVGADSPETNEVWRFVEKDGDATLERIAFESDAALHQMRLRGRAQLRPKAVATIEGVTAWAFRDSDGSVVLLARGGDFGRHSISATTSTDGTEAARFASSSCAFGAARLDRTRLLAGATARLNGTLRSTSSPAPTTEREKQAEEFVLDGSVAKTSRDPEPILSVRFRRRVKPT